MMLVDKDCRITNINATGLAFAGKPKEESLGFLCGEVFSCINSFDSLGCGKNAPCQNCPILTKIIYTFETGQEVYDAEGRLLVRKGSTDVPVDVLISTALVKDKDADKVLVTINDITERKRVQAELFNSRQMLRSILDHIPQRVFWKDRNCVFLGCNKAFALDGGYEDPDQIVGKTSCEISSAAFADRYCADDREVMETGRPKINYEEPQIRLDGSHAWLITSKVPMYDQDGQVIGVLGTYSDITEQKLMEEEIRQANAYLENIFENSPDAIGIVDKHGRFIRWNKMAERLSGDIFEEMKGKSAFDLYADKDKLEKMLISLRREGSVKKREMRMKRKDGSIVPSEISIGLLKDSQNGIIGSVAVARDLRGIKETLAALRASNKQLNLEISERTQSEMALEESEERYRILFEGCNHGILAADIETKRFVFANPSICQMLGYTENELLDLGIEDIHPKDYLNVVLPEVESQFRGEKKLSSALPCLRKDGAVFFADMASAINVIRGRKLAVGFFFDVTERKLAEDALRESEERFSAFFRTSAVGTSITRLIDGQFVNINDAFLDLFGYTREEVIGQNYLKLGMWANPEDRAKLVEVMQEQGRIKDFETRFVSKSGEIRDVLISSEVIEAAGEQYILGLTFDITERKRIEEALRESEGKYRELVQNANSIILRMDNMGNLTFFNEFAQNFFGYSEEEILGKNVVGTVVPEVESTTGRDLRSMIEDIAVNPYSYANNENENMRRNGERVWIAWTNKPVFDENGRIREILCIGNDITERKLAENALRESEERFSKFFHASPIGTCISRLSDGQFVNVNDAFLGFFGYTREELIGHSVLELGIWAHPESRAKVREILQEHGSIRDIEDQGVRKSGEIIDLVGFGEMIVIAGEQYILSNVYDITERKRIEEALRQSEETYRELVQNANSVIIRWKRDGTIIFFNEYAQKFFGYSAEEVIGKSVNILVPQHGSNGSNLTGLVQDIVNYPERYERNISENILRDGGRVWMAWTNRPVFDHDGQVVEILAVGTDITERKQAEVALSLRESYVRAILENQPGLVWLKDKESRFLAVNHTFARSCGIESTEKLLGKTDLDIWPTELAEKHINEDKAVMTARAPVAVEEIISVGGETKWFETFKTPVIDKDGEILGTTGYARDISERKLLEQALKKVNEGLEIQIEERTRELDAKTRRLEEFNAALRVLLKLREEDRTELEESILVNVRELVVPYIEKLKKSRLGGDQMTYLTIIESHMFEITSPFTKRLYEKYLGLTPMEIQTADLIKEGKITKEIAELLNVSVNTVSSNRFHIRKKLGLTNKQINLRYYLKHLDK